MAPQIPNIESADIERLIAEGGEPAERLARIRSERIARSLLQEKIALEVELKAMRAKQTEDA